MDIRKLTILLVALSMFQGCRKSKTVEAQEERVVPVGVALPRTGSIEEAITLTGVILADPMTPVLPDVPGKFIRYTVSEGQRVRKGQVVAYLDRRMPGMDYRQYPVEAPASGRIHLLNIPSGQMVSPQSPVAQIYGRPYIQLKVPGIYFESIKVGDVIRVDGRTARIYYKSSLLDPMTSTFEVRAHIEDVVGRMVDARLVVRRAENALLVPTSAVLGVETKSVFVLKDGVAKRRVVKVGISREDWTQILEGLGPNDTVITLGNRNLVDGMKVRVVK